MTVYKIECEWEMPLVSGVLFATEELAQKAIELEDWNMADSTLEDVLEDGYAVIIPVKVITKL